MDDRSHWTERVPTVVCVGLSAFDYVWHVDALPAACLGKVRAGDFATRGGGMAATGAVAVARLGSRAHFWGRAGDDTEGRRMQGELAAEGVDVTAFRLFAGARSSISGVFVDPSGERHIANFRGTSPAEPDFLPLSPFPAANAVLGDPRWPEGVAATFAAARAAGVPTVLDAEVAEPAVFDALLPLTDHALFSEPALVRYAGGAGADALTAVRARGPAVAGVTLGERGVTVMTECGLVHRDAFAVAAVDTNGAGDVFHGAYALAVGAGAPLADALAFASAAAALKCTRPDGRRGIPGRAETLALWRHT